MRRSPIHKAGGSYNEHTDNKHTEWYINWRHQTRQGPQGCIAHKIKTVVHVVYILPAPSKHVTDRQTIEIFNSFNDALTAH